jgi:hypothetical protein
MSITFEPVPEQAPVITIDVPVDTPTEMDRREILLKAAEAIQTHGWTIGVEGMIADGPLCLLGAVAHASGQKPFGYSDDDPGVYDMREAANVLGVDAAAAYSWNDTLQYKLRMRRPHLFAKKMPVPGEEVVSVVLRRMANGVDFYDAIRF